MTSTEQSAVRGSCSDEFAALRTAFEEQLASGEELGASIAVVQGGEFVVDLWGGHVDETRTAPWQQDAIVNVFSITKTMTALSALLMVDRGLIELDRPVATYWPEFGRNGKDAITPRQLLSHTSGVSGWEKPIELEDIYDGPSAASRLAGQAPWWEPGTASGYHVLNYGHLIGELIRRVDGRSLGRFFADEIAGPLDADFHIGTPASEFGRIAPLVPPPALDIDWSLMGEDSILVKSVTSPILDYARTSDAAWRSAEIGAANGHGNARSIARIQSIVAGGGRRDGKQWLSESTIDEIFAVQADGIDLAILTPLKFGTGYGLPQPDTVPMLPDRRICWWAGIGGSFVVNDLDRDLTFAYAMNRMAPGLIGSDRATAYLAATFGGR